MLLPNKYRSGIVIAAVFIISLVVLRYNFQHSSPGTLRKLALEIIASIGHVANEPFRKLEHIWRRYIYLVGLEEENRRLKAKNSLLAREILTYREGYLESIRLQNILQLQNNTSFPTLAARVLGKYPSSLFKMILINRGEADGIRSGMPVVAVSGVVGRIMETSWNISRVLLIVDENSNIDALIQDSRVHGIIQGASSAGCILKYVPKTADIRIGDIVVSSGMGGMFPKGLPLGIVRFASKKEAELFQKIAVTPLAEMSNLEEVLVILPKPGGGY